MQFFATTIAELRGAGRFQLRGRAESPEFWLSQQAQKLIACINIFLELAEHHRGGHGRILLLHTAHHHAQMSRLHYNANTLAIGHLLHGIGDLLSQVFLDLQPARVHVDDSRHLRQANNLAAW